MDRQVLDTLEALHRDSNSSEWVATHEEHPADAPRYAIWTLTTNNNRWHGQLQPGWMTEGGRAGYGMRAEDAHYAAAAMNAVPHLIAEIRRLDRLIARQTLATSPGDGESTAWQTLATLPARRTDEGPLAYLGRFAAQMDSVAHAIPSIPPRYTDLARSLSAAADRLPPAIVDDLAQHSVIELLDLIHDAAEPGAAEPSLGDFDALVARMADYLVSRSRLHHCSERDNAL